MTGMPQRSHSSPARSLFGGTRREPAFPTACSVSGENAWSPVSFGPVAGRADLSR